MIKNLKNSQSIRKEKGITLVALIVTIIVLIILAAVTIVTLTGENGVLNNAYVAKEENQKQNAEELMRLKISGINMKSYKEVGEAATLQFLADKLCEDDEMEYVLKESKPLASLEKINVSDTTSIYTKMKDYEYEFEINNSLNITNIKDMKSEEEKEDPNPDSDVDITDKVARIDTICYKTLQEAIDAVPETSESTQTTIVILKDIEENVTILGNKNIVLDLNNKTISGAENNNVTITIGAASDDNPKVEIINSGTIVSSGNYNNGIINYGTLNINETAQIEMQSAQGIYSFKGANLNINGGKITFSNNGINNYGDTVISGASYLTNNRGFLIRNYSNINITGGIMKVKGSVLFLNDGKNSVAIIDGVEMETTVANALRNSSGATMTINGGTIITKEENAIKNSGTLIINGGTIKSESTRYYAIYNEQGSVRINGGTISSKYGC